MVLKIYDLHLGMGIVVCTRHLGERLMVLMHINEHSIKSGTLINRGFQSITLKLLKQLSGINTVSFLTVQLLCYN